MRVLKTFFLVALVVTVLEATSLTGDLRDAAARALTGDTATSATEQKSYDRLCPLFDVWADMDADGRRATTKTIEALARQQAQATDDPAVTAFLIVIPDALATGNSARSKAARALIDRECRAHDN